MNAYLSQRISEVTTNKDEKVMTDSKGHREGTILGPWPSTHPQPCRRARRPFWSNWTRGPDSALQSEEGTGCTVLETEEYGEINREAHCPLRPAHETWRPRGQDLTLTPGGPQTSMPLSPCKKPPMELTETKNLERSKTEENLKEK